LDPFGGEVYLVLFKISRDWQLQSSAMGELSFSGTICGIMAFQLNNILNYSLLLATVNSLSKRQNKRTPFRDFSTTSV
jgi:hypothetical protein